MRKTGDMTQIGHLREIELLHVRPLMHCLEQHTQNSCCFRRIAAPCLARALRALQRQPNWGFYTTATIDEAILSALLGIPYSEKPCHTRYSLLFQAVLEVKSVLGSLHYNTCSLNSILQLCYRKQAISYSSADSSFQQLRFLIG